MKTKDAAVLPIPLPRGYAVIDCGCRLSGDCFDVAFGSFGGDEFFGVVCR